MRETLYFFKLSDGSDKCMSFSEAIANYPLDSLVQEKIHKIRESWKNRKRKKDGFQPGWQPNINRYAGGRKEYDKILKDEGLVEIGNDYIPQESKLDINPCANIGFALAAKEAGLIESDSEVDAVISGEIFKD